MADEVYINPDIDNIVKSIKQIAEMDDDLVERVFPILQENLEMSYSDEMKEQAANQVIKGLEDQRLTREQAKVSLEAAAETLREMTHINDLTGKKKEMAEIALAPVFDSFNEALKRYHLYNIDLPITVEEGAQVPTYAHDSDACADIYALEDVIIGANTYGNKVRTGVAIQLPEGWMAMIFPRSSIGAKTPLRLSNSVGIIDSGYRGELGVLFDNISNESYAIKAGDRVAQLMIMPSYRFNPTVVETLEDSDRGTNGFGSTGN